MRPAFHFLRGRFSWCPRSRETRPKRPLCPGSLEDSASEVVFSVLDTYSVSYPENPVPRHIGWLTWLSVVPGAAAEELIVRAYLMTEVAELTGRMWIAVLASVGFQTLYHLYQGTPYALVSAGSFFVAALFYANTRRATPLILAHAWHNFWVLY